MVMRLVLALLPVLLAGCSTQSSAPDPQPTPSSTVTRQVLSVPQLPPMAGTHTPAGVSEFVRYYVDAISYALQSGSTRVLRSSSARGCEGCNEVAEGIEDVYRAGGFIETEGWDVESYELRSFDGAAVVEMVVRQAAARTYYDATDEAESADAKLRQVAIRLVPRRVGWLVASLELR